MTLPGAEDDVVHDWKIVSGSYGSSLLVRRGPEAPWVEANAYDSAALIEQQRRTIEEFRGAIRNYLDEFESPAPDYTLRSLYRKKLRALLQGDKKE